MSKSKTLIGTLLTLSACYTVFVWNSIDLGSPQNNCQQGLRETLAPWSSGCFYALDFEDKEQSISKLALQKENSQLLDFKRNEGVTPEILWYRAKFNRRYRNELKRNFEHLHHMHMDYTLSEHTRIDRQVDYLAFIARHDLIPLAQETLDLYCKNYLRKRGDKVLKELYLRLENVGLSLNFKTCIDKLYPTSRDLFLQKYPL